MTVAHAGIGGPAKSFDTSVETANWSVCATSAREDLSVLHRPDTGGSRTVECGAGDGEALERCSVRPVQRTSEDRRDGSRSPWSTATGTTTVRRNLAGNLPVLHLSSRRIRPARLPIGRCRETIRVRHREKGRPRLEKWNSVPTQRAAPVQECANADN